MLTGAASSPMEIETTLLSAPGEDKSPGEENAKRRALPGFVLGLASTFATKLCLVLSLLAGWQAGGNSWLLLLLLLPLLMMSEVSGTFFSNAVNKPLTTGSVFSPVFKFLCFLSSHVL